MKDHYQTIQGWFNCPGLYSRVVAQAPDDAVFVEIGCWKGKSSSYLAEQIANSGKSIKLYCVDTWKGSKGEPIHDNDPDVINQTLFETFTANMKPFEQYYTAIRSTSLQAAEKFENNSLDFVYIDASHFYKDVKDDVSAWLPKVKKGGIIAGDDYNSRDVKKAVLQVLKKVDQPNRFTWVHKVK
jgi:predicted O-methyltransferase YrrM